MARYLLGTLARYSRDALYYNFTRYLHDAISDRSCTVVAMGWVHPDWVRYRAPHGADKLGQLKSGDQEVDSSTLFGGLPLQQDVWGPTTACLRFHKEG